MILRYCLPKPIFHKTLPISHMIFTFLNIKTVGGGFRMVIKAMQNVTEVFNQDLD